MVKNLPVNAGDTRDAVLILGLRGSLGGGNGNPLQYCCLGDSMDRGAGWTTVCGIVKGSDMTKQQHLYAYLPYLCH